MCASQACLHAQLFENDEPFGQMRSPILSRAVSNTEGTEGRRRLSIASVNRLTQEEHPLRDFRDGCASPAMGDRTGWHADCRAKILLALDEDVHTHEVAISCSSPLSPFFNDQQQTTHVFPYQVPLFLLNLTPHLLS
jgi:hypothetical protein